LNQNANTDDGAFIVVGTFLSHDSIVAYPGGKSTKQDSQRIVISSQIHLLEWYATQNVERRIQVSEGIGVRTIQSCQYFVHQRTYQEIGS
jgi:hypothetical protein